MVKDSYPFKSHFLDIDGLKYHYLNEGKGEAVLMLHGNPTWSFYYRNLVIALRDKYQVIVPDHIGCGLSDKPADDRYRYTLKQRVADLEKLVKHLRLENINLVVHDWGGMIGMVLATRHPELIRRLVVMNTAAFHLPESKRFPWQLCLVRNTPIGKFLVRRLNAFCLGATYMCCKRQMSREARKGYLAPYDSWQNRIAVMRFVQDIPLKPSDPAYRLVSDVEKNLGKLSHKPIIIFWGEKDFVFDYHFREQWQHHFPKAKVHSFMQYGHYILEDASDEIIPMVKKFLDLPQT